jgi:TonB family protein
METLARQEIASPETEPELNLLLERDRRGEWRRWRKAGIVSVAVHIVLLMVLLLMPESESRLYDQPQPTLHFTPLYTPTELTQKDPNKGKISKELTIPSIPPAPALKAPTPAPPVKRAPPPPPAPPPQVAKAEPKPVIVEPPKIDPPKTQAEPIANLNPPPPPPSTQQPKLVLENVGSPPPPTGANQGKPLGGIAIPSLTADSAIHDITTNGASLGGHQSVGDTGAEPPITGRNLPASPGSLPPTPLELVSDPKGVDFRPYLIQVLAAVRRNWFAVYPEAAKAGSRGEVQLEFAIAKQGLVAKVIYSGQSGSKPLDEAAVAAISASNPLPPLPKEFKGDRIVLRMTFMYNMKR